MHNYIKALLYSFKFFNSYQFSWYVLNIVIKIKEKFYLIKNK